MDNRTRQRTAGHVGFRLAVVTSAAVTLTAVADEPAGQPAATPAIHVAHRGLSKLAWQLAVPTGTFAGRTVFDTVDLLHGLDIHHLELTPGQLLSADRPGVLAGHGMPADAVAALAAKLKSVHMDVVSYGPVDLGGDEAAARAVFAFAKQLKAKCVVASPPPDALDRLDPLATEYGLNLAIVNGPTPAPYRTPQQVLAATARRSPRLGGADVLPAWQSAGVDPVGATDLLRGHIVQVRVGDVGGAAVDVRGALAVLRRQAFKGAIVIACRPGTDRAAIGADPVVRRFIDAANALSDDVTAVAADDAAGK